MNLELQKKANVAQKTFNAWKAEMRRQGHTKREELDPTEIDEAQLRGASRALWDDYQDAQGALNQEAGYPSQPELSEDPRVKAPPKAKAAKPAKPGGSKHDRANGRDYAKLESGGQFNAVSSEVHGGRYNIDITLEKDGETGIPKFSQDYDTLEEAWAAFDSFVKENVALDQEPADPAPAAPKGEMIVEVNGVECNVTTEQKEGSCVFTLYWHGGQTSKTYTDAAIAKSTTLEKFIQKNFRADVKAPEPSAPPEDVREPEAV